MDNTHNARTQNVLWSIVVLLSVGLILYGGFKLFYGVIVPQAEAATNLGSIAVLGFSFVAGLAAFFAPCPFAVFPAYVAYYLEGNTEHTASESSLSGTARAVGVGSIVSTGVFSFYLILGGLMVTFGTALAAYTNWLKLAIIPLFFIFGGLLLFGKSLPTGWLDRLQGILTSKSKQAGSSLLGMYLYGLVYGIAAAACHLPILIVLALTPILSGQIVVGLLAFITYALATSLVLIGLTVAVEKNKSIVVDNIGLYGKRLKQAVGVVFLFTGVYLISFYVIFGM